MACDELKPRGSNLEFAQINCLRLIGSSTNLLPLTITWHRSVISGKVKLTYLNREQQQAVSSIVCGGVVGGGGWKVNGSIIPYCNFSLIMPISRWTSLLNIPARISLTVASNCESQRDCDKLCILCEWGKEWRSEGRKMVLAGQKAD